MLRAQRRLVIRYASRMLRDGLAAGTYGNISVCTGGRVVITPSDLPYRGMRTRDVCVVDFDGAQVSGTTKPSSELAMHLRVYADSDARTAIVHTHSPYATAVACVIDEIPALHYAVAEFGGAIPTVPYEAPGSEALAERVRGALRNGAGALLQSHGAVTVGASLAQAYSRAVMLEWIAQLYHHARTLGEPIRLDSAEVAQLPRRAGVA